MSFYDDFNYDLLNNGQKQSGGNITGTVNKTFGNGKIGYPDNDKTKRKPYFKRKEKKDKQEDKVRLIEEEIYDMKETMFLSELQKQENLQDSTIGAMVNRKIIFERDYDLRFTDIEDDEENQKKKNIDNSKNFETYSVFKQNALTLKLSNALNDYDDLNKEVEEFKNIYDICNNPFDIIYDPSANNSIKKKESIEKIISDKYYIDHIVKNFDNIESQQTFGKLDKFGKLRGWKTRNQRIKYSGLYKPDEITDDPDLYYNKYKDEVKKDLSNNGFKPPNTKQQSVSDDTTQQSGGAGSALVRKKAKEIKREEAKRKKKKQTTNRNDKK